MDLVDCKSFQICLSPKEILLWRQPTFTMLCYLVLYYFIGLLEHQSVVTTCSLLVLAVLVTEFAVKEVCLKLFDCHLTYTDQLSTPMSPLSTCIQDIWSLAWHVLGSLQQPTVAMLAVACGCVLAILSAYMDTVSLLSTLLSIVMVGPAMYYASRYSHLAQAFAQFSASVCQPALLDDDEEEEVEDEKTNAGGVKEGSYRDIFKEEPEPKQQPSPPTEVQVSVSSSRRSSSTSVNLEEYDVISSKELTDDEAAHL